MQTVPNNGKMQTTVVDWLQLHVDLSLKQFETTDCIYYIEKQNYGTRHFRELYTIYDRKGGNEIAVLCAVPVMDGMDDNFGLLKIVNRVLYQQNLKQYVIGLLDELKLTFRNITRIDIAHDFTVNCTRLHPERLMRSYIDGTFIKTGSAKVKNNNKTAFKTDRKTQAKITDDVFKAIEQSGIKLDHLAELKLTANLKRKTSKNYQYTESEQCTLGMQNRSRVYLESLKFGTEKSPLSYILYNKTKEMSDVKHKQWICDNWLSHGWNGIDDVWRLEYSFKSSTKKFIEVDTGETIGFDTLDILDNIGNIFSLHYKKYFLFVRSTGKSRKDREKKVTFLSGIKHNYVTMKLSSMKEAKRSDKIFAKKLHEVNAELRGVDFDLSIYGNDYLQTFVNSRGLSVWAEKKIFYKGSENQQKHRQRDTYEQTNKLISVLLYRKSEKTKFDFDTLYVPGLYEKKCYNSQLIIPQVNKKYCRPQKLNYIFKNQ